MKKDLKNLVIMIGAIIIAAIILSVPILCGLSWALAWAGELQVILTIMTVVEMTLLAAGIAITVTDGWDQRFVLRK